MNGVCDEEWAGLVADVCEPRPIVSSAKQFTGRIWSVRTDSVNFDGQLIERDILVHLGAVAIIAIDDQDRVLLIRQYRHPVAMALFEPPAGLLDISGESPQVTAARELAEESGYQAASWQVLVDFLNSPGGSSEAIRVYLARGLTPLVGGRAPTGEAEEAYLPRVWVPLEAAKDLVMTGAIGSPSAVCGILAAWAARESGWTNLRPANGPWPVRDLLLAQGRVHSS
ncbi:MAG: NUDIX hydrolase [Candidatus Nanopelagicales bacterium]|nr:NUDIX hydrolase [Candidatus Nanopelagicales bacterium]